MKNLEFNQRHYDQMLKDYEEYEGFTFEQLKEQIEKGAEIVDKNGGFANLDTILDESGMIATGAFINFRTAKRDLNEYVEEIDT